MTESGWKPWYEEMASKSTEAERNAVLYGTFAPPPMDPVKFAAGAASGYAFGWGLKNLWRAIRGR